MKFKILFLMFFIIISTRLSADDGPLESIDNSADITQSSEIPIVAVGDAEIEKELFVVLNPGGDSVLSLKEKTYVEELLSIIKNDIGFYKSRFFVATSSKLPAVSTKEIDYEFWKKYPWVIGSFVKIENGKKTLLLTSYNTLEKKELFTTETPILEQKIDRAVAHNISHEIYTKITGKEKSIFKSKIAFVSDITSSKDDVRKELYIMDFDGANIKRLTHHNGIVISPSFSYDNKKIIYSLIKSTGKKNINLYIYDLDTQTVKIVSSRKGINSGAIFLPGDKDIILTLSYVGNAEIFKMKLYTKQLTRITNHYGHDVDPSINHDGTLMTFLSSRPGKAMIYTLTLPGMEQNVKRISYVGQFNATPRFSPDGKEIVFSSWVDNRFDLYRIDANGNNLVRLTKNFGSNEDPTYSKDGQFIAFSSQRVVNKHRTIQNVYIIDREGEIVGQITKRFGNCITPVWSK